MAVAIAVAVAATNGNSMQCECALLLVEGKATVDETQTPNRVDQHIKHKATTENEKIDDRLYTRNIYLYVNNDKNLANWLPSTHRLSREIIS